MERFIAMVRTDDDGCHRWTGCITSKGYGKFRIGSTIDKTRRTVQAHRWHYEQKNGPIPEGLEPDHLCRNRECVRIEHLEPVTCSINQKRGTGGKPHPSKKCPKGHSMDGHNIITRKDGRRNCRACKNATLAAWKRKRRQKQAEEPVAELITV